MPQTADKTADKPQTPEKPKPAVVSGDRLTLNEVLDWLVEDKMIESAAADQLKKERRYYKGALHPLVTVAEQKWKNLLPPHKPLPRLSAITGWPKAPVIPDAT